MCFSKDVLGAQIRGCSVMVARSRSSRAGRAFGIIGVVLLVSIGGAFGPLFAPLGSGSPSSTAGVQAAVAAEVTTSPLFEESLRETTTRLETDVEPRSRPAADAPRRPEATRGGVLPSQYDTFTSMSTCGVTRGSTCGSSCGYSTCGYSSCCDDDPSPSPGDPSDPAPDDPAIGHDSYTVGDTKFWPLWGDDRYETAVALSQDGWDMPTLYCWPPVQPAGCSRVAQVWQAHSLRRSC